MSEDLPLERPSRSFVERTPREAERGGADGRAEDIERGHGDLESLAGPAQQAIGRNAAFGEAQRA